MHIPNQNAEEEQNQPVEPPVPTEAIQQPGELPIKPPTLLDRLYNIWPYIGIVSIVFLFYLPALKFHFIWDDDLIVSNLPLILNPDQWAKVLFRFPVFSPNQFRPLALLVLLGEYRLGGAQSFIYHLISLLLHLVNTLLVSLLVKRLIGQTTGLHHFENTTLAKILVAGVGLLYGLYPALIEGVAFISSQFELLMVAFLLLALLSSTASRSLAPGGQPRSKWLKPVLLAIFFLLALLCKETAWGLILVLPFWQLATTPLVIPEAEPSKRDEEPVAPSRVKLFFQTHWPDYLAVLLTLGVYLGVRWAGLGFLWISVESQQQAMGSILARFLLFIKTMATYVVIMLWPFTSLSPLHLSVLPVKPTDASAWLALALIILLILGLIWLVRREKRAGWLAISCVVSLLPVANLVSYDLGSGLFSAERFLVFPVTLAILAFGALIINTLPVVTAFLSKTPRRGMLPIPVTILIFWLAASLVTIQLVLPNWSDDVSLWSWAARRSPNSSLPLTNLAFIYNNRGQFPMAAETAQQAIGLNNQDANAWNNLGLAMFYMGNYPEAQSAFDQTTKIRPDDALFWNNLAGALREQDNLVEAEKLLIEKALTLNPNLPAAHVSLGIIYLRTDRPDLAYQHLQYAVQISPPSQVAEAQTLLEQAKQPDRWLRLGDMFMQSEQYDLAASAYNMAASFGAPVSDAAYGFTSALIALKDWGNAKTVLDKIIVENPQDARLYYNLGIIAREQNDLESARQAFSKAIELKPDWELPQKALAELPQP